MRALVAFAVLLALLLGGCTTKPAQEEAAEIPVALAYVNYELRSLGDKDIPAELPNGLVLVSGSCKVNATGLFQLELEYRGETEGLGLPRSISGEYSLLGAADDEGQQPARFVATGGDLEMEAEADGTFFISGMSIGGEITKVTSDVMVFKLVSGEG